MLIMPDNDPNPAVTLIADWNSHFDLYEIIDQVWNGLEGKSSRSDIRKVLIEVAPKYERATILTYILILLCRDVRRQLLGRL